MSLAIAFKGPEGIVLAADSRVTLTTKPNESNEKSQITYDNATKLLRVPGHDYAGAVAYGVAALGGESPRTIHSYLPELEDFLEDKGRLSVRKFANRLSAFFQDQWTQTMPANSSGDVCMLVGGYNENEPYGRVYLVKVPSSPAPIEQNPGANTFGLSWGGQLKYTNRLINGMDPQVVPLTKAALNLSDDDTKNLTEHLEKNIGVAIPYQFLALQDCVDLSVFLIKTTLNLMRFVLEQRGVGGAIDVAAVTRTEGFKYIQKKTLSINSY